VHTVAFVTDRWNRIVPLWFIISVYWRNCRSFDIGRVLCRSIIFSIVAPNSTRRILLFPQTLDERMIHLIFSQCCHSYTVACSIWNTCTREIFSEFLREFFTQTYFLRNDAYVNRSHAKHTAAIPSRERKRERERERERERGREIYILMTNRQSFYKSILIFIKWVAGLFIKFAFTFLM